MDISRFKQLHKKFKTKPLPKEVWDTPEYEQYTDAIHEDEACGQYYLECHLKDKGFAYERFCCLDMAYHLAFPGDRNDVDQIIDCSEKQQNFGIPIHDGGSSWIEIKYCPWCGTAL